jgi:diguanylate cyclase (GGDEF)-like protein/PAS domain S-box-containing protein
MNLQFFQLRSIKTRVTLFTLAIFVLSIWLISIYASRTLQGDMQRVLGEQQFATVSMEAGDINDDVQDRLDALEVIAATLAPALAGGAAATQTALESKPVFQHLFNSGSFVTGMDGTAIASFPVSIDRLGINFMERDHVAAALKRGQSSVSKPVISKALNNPVIGMAVPIRDPKGQVIGALIGVTDLGKPNFLDKIVKATFNKAGIVSVISPQHRITVASSDKSLVMAALPAPGVNPYLDKNIAGFEGYTIVVNVLGQEQLASVKKIPAAQWYLYSGMSAEEVFAPIRAMQHRILLATLLLTLLAGSLTRWMLKRQLAPMFDTANKLAHMAESVETPQPLPMTRHDEIGELIVGFNRLLETLGMREAALRESEERYRTAFKTSPDAVNINRLADGQYLEINDGFTRVVGWTSDEVVGRTSQEINIWRNTEDRQRLVEALQSKGFCENLEADFVAKDGKVIRALMSAHVMKLQGVPCILSVTRDITERKTAEAQIRSLAFSDPLTGLPNRRLLKDRLEQAMAAASRHGYQSALLFIDLDDFKLLNDTLGHDKGDLLLKQIANRLISCVREGDTVARLGGDEFVVLLENLSSTLPEAAAQAQVVAVKILSTLGHPYELEGHGHHSTASIGVTLFGGTSRENIEEPLKRAELAMYEAKATGRNSMRFFEPKMQTALASRAALEVDLRDALSKCQFVLYYQGQCGAENRLSGVEALVRWQHPRRGLVSPLEFIPIAEAGGLILPLGRWVMETACKQLAAWGLRPERSHLTMAVNVSARQIRQSDFVQEVLTILETTGAKPERLKLELTESVLLDNLTDTIAKMNALKAQGVGFSLDDFGTGYSSLSYLKRLPLDQLKIDKSFVNEILTDPNDAAIANMVVALAQSMGLVVIAEGVETESQRAFLAKLGCHNYQGYLFNKPVPIDEFEAFAAQPSYVALP